MTAPDPHNHPKNDARGPRRLVSEPGEAVRAFSAASCPTPLELAAYIDGRADEQLAERIDVHLVRCAECLALVREARSIQSEQSDSLIFVPPHVLEAAMSLMKGESKQTCGVVGGDAFQTRTARRRIALWISITQRGAAAAAAIAIGVLGHHVGASLSTPAALASAADSSTQTSTDLSFGLDPAVDDLSTETDLLTIDSTEEVTS